MFRTALLSGLVSSAAFANASGAIGYSGAPGTGSCNDCHTGGGAPTVTITGPASLAAGATGAYSVTVTGGARVGVNIALATNNTLAALNPTSGNLGLAFRELFQVSPQNSGAQFNFTLTAPPVAGPMVIYATGNAVDGNGATSGDRSASTSKMVDIMMGSGALKPVVMTPAAAMQSPLRTKSTDVTIVAADDGGAANLTYIWSATGPGAVVFSPNSSNSAATSKATFSRSGSYMITCTVRDSLNNTETSTFALTVETVLTAIKMTPYAVKLATNATQMFNAAAVDQFEVPVMPAPAVTFEVPAGGGVFGTNCVNACTSNVFKAQANSGGPFTVVARSMGIATSSTVAVGTTNLPTASDTTPPAVALVEPASGLPLTAGEVFEAIASDPPPNPTGISKVEFWIAEVPITSITVTSSPWRATYQPVAGLPGGKQPLIAVAYDLAGNSTKSSSVIVDVPMAPTAGGSGTAGSGGTGGGSGTAGSGTGGGTPDGGCYCGASGDGSVIAIGLALLAYSVSRRRRATRRA